MASSSASGSGSMQVTLSPSPVSERGDAKHPHAASYFARLEPAAIENTLLDMNETIKGLEDLMCTVRAPARSRTAPPSQQISPTADVDVAVTTPAYTHQTFAHGYFGPLPPPSNKAKPKDKKPSKSKSMREHALSLPIPSLSAHGLHLKMSSAASGSGSSSQHGKDKKRGRRLADDTEGSGSGTGSRSQSKHKKVMNMFTKRPSLSRASQSEFSIYPSTTSPPARVASSPSLLTAEPEQEPEQALFSYLSEAILQLRHQHAHLLHLIPAPAAAAPPTPPPDSDSDNDERFDAELEAITASALQQASTSAISEQMAPTRPPLALVSSKGHLSRASIASTNVSVSIWHDAESRPSSPEPSVAHALAAVVERPASDDDETVVHNTPPGSIGKKRRGVPAVDPASVKRRTKLEIPAPPAPGLKAAVKAISNATAAGSMPLLFNEPFGVLQRMAEEMEYTALIATAIKTTDPIARLCYVAAFAMSNYASSAHRGTRKPCNPLLGETFELDRPDLGFRFVAEKVSHVPMQTASHAEGKGWVMRGLTQVKQGRKKASYEVAPLGYQYLELADWHETYRWDKPPTYVSLNPFGSSSPCICGTMSVVNETSGHVLELEFKEAGRALEGVARDSSGEAQAWIRGNWDTELFARFGLSSASETRIWQAHPFGPNCEQSFGLSPFALTLNELSPDLYDADGNLLIAPTDTRLRPDQRLYEQGRIDEAEALKHELETRQRRRNSEKRQVGPRWFRCFPGRGEAGTDEWRYDGGYWEARSEENWVDASRELW